MSEKGGRILNTLWNKVDQADYDMMITEAFSLLPTAVQKRFIQELLDNDRWDMEGRPEGLTDKEKQEYRRYVSE